MCCDDPYLCEAVQLEGQPNTGGSMNGGNKGIVEDFVA